jgi:hypothetical protein
MLRDGGPPRVTIRQRTSKWIASGWATIRSELANERIGLYTTVDFCSWQFAEHWPISLLLDSRFHGRAHNPEPELWMASLIQLGEAYVHMF